jgi:hypothetical protein
MGPPRLPTNGWQNCGATSPHTTHDLSSPKKIQYRHHPFFGTEVKVIRTLRRFLDEIDIVQFPEGFQIAVPRWMLDPVACSQLPQEGKPRVAVRALFQLVQLVQLHRLPPPPKTAGSDTSQPTKAKHVFTQKSKLSSSSVTTAQENALGKVPGSHARPLPSSIDSDPPASRPQRFQGKEPR